MQVNADNGQRQAQALNTLRAQRQREDDKETVKAENTKAVEANKEAQRQERAPDSRRGVLA
ncbi:MAG: hypothetical protein FJX68_16960 [Alphaproteobacteria bacterium]|nr:hypothetical protein [Alphaproteobacteria bacterium]